MACALVASPTFAGFTGIAIVQNDARNAAARAALVNAGVPGAETAVVYRLYATFDGPGDGLNNTVVATVSANIFMTVAGWSFYQDAFGSALPPNDAFFPLAPSVQFDSYGTIGAITLGDGGNISVGPGAEETLSSYTGDWFTGTPSELTGAAVAQSDLDGSFGTMIFQFTVIGLGVGCEQNSIPPFRGYLTIFMPDPNNLGNTQDIFSIIGPLSPPCSTEIASSPNDRFSIINGADLGALLIQWGPATGCETTADFNHDGTVDGVDLGMLLVNWGCSP